MSVFKEKLIDSTVLAYAFGVGFLIPLIALGALGAMEDPDNVMSFVFYAGLLVASIILIAFARFTEYGKQSLLGAILFDPERGFVSKNFHFFKNPLLVLWASVIMALGIGLFSVISGTFFFGKTSYQIHPFGQILAGAEPASLTETLIQCILIGIAYKLALRISNNKKNALFWGAYLVLSFLSIFFMLALHFARYGASETKMMETLGLFFAVWLMVVALGTFLIPYVIHFFNNLLYEAKNIYSSDAVITITWIVFILLTLGFIWYLTIYYRQPTRQRTYA